MKIIPKSRDKTRDRALGIKRYNITNMKKTCRFTKTHLLKLIELSAISIRVNYC